MPDNISLLNFRYSPVKISLIIAALSTASQPARAIEFATGILNMDDNDKVNLKKFERAGYIAPGKYRLSVSLNNNLLHDDVDIHFRFRRRKKMRDHASLLSWLIPWPLNLNI